MDFEHIAVIGAGAVGAWHGALLARAGHAVQLVGRDPAAMAALAREGLRVDSTGAPEAGFVARPGAGVSVAAVAPAALVLVCVKSADTAGVAAALAAPPGFGGIVASLQNGMGNAEALAAALGRPVLAGLVYAALERPSATQVQHHGGGELVLGWVDADGRAAADAPARALLERLAAALRAAGIGARASADIEADRWRKLITNGAWNAASALAQAPYGRMAQLPEVMQLLHTLVQEGLAVAAAAGVALDAGEVHATVRGIAARMPAQRSSTAQDLARGRRSEIDALNGWLVRRGASLGVPTPAHQAMHALVKLVEAGQMPRPAAPTLG